MVNGNDLRIDVFYCLEHEAYFVTYVDEGGRYHVDSQGNICYGTYTDSPPPPQLTKVEWEQLLNIGELVEVE